MEREVVSIVLDCIFQVGYQSFVLFLREELASLELSFVCHVKLHGEVNCYGEGLFETLGHEGRGILEVNFERTSQLIFIRMGR